MRKIVLFTMAYTFCMLTVVATHEKAKEALFDIALDNPMRNQVRVIKNEFSQELSDLNAFLTNVCEDLSQTITQNFTFINLETFDKNSFATLSKKQTILLAVLYRKKANNPKGFVLGNDWASIFQSIPADVITLMFGDNFESKIIPLSDIPDLDLADDDVPPLENAEKNFPQRSLTNKRQNSERQKSNPSAKKAKNN